MASLSSTNKTAMTGLARVPARVSHAIARRALSPPLRARIARQPATKRGLAGARGATIAIRAAVGQGQGGLEMVTLKAGDQVAEVYTFGGVCTSWTVNGKDVLYVRPDAKFDKSKPISGGIPHCWPQFGPGDMQVHGFARNCQWELTSSSDTACTMTLLPSEYTKSMWDFDFKVTQTIELKEGGLEATMCVHNTDTKDFSFTGSFHTYFACEDISEVAVGGLEGLTVLDRLAGEEDTVTSDVTINGPVDSVYYDVQANPLSLAVGGERQVAIGYAGWPDAVVWSPWTDMEACYKEFVCVENAAAKPITVAAGSSWTGVMTLSCNK